MTAHWRLPFFEDEKSVLGVFPSLKRRGGRDINKKFPFRRDAAGVVSSAKVLKMHSEAFRRTDHPGCAISVASRLFVSAQPPLLFKEGKGRSMTAQDSRR
jgi:hypothetical protein